MSVLFGNVDTRTRYVEMDTTPKLTSKYSIQQSDVVVSAGWMTATVPRLSKASLFRNYYNMSHIMTSKKYNQSCLKFMGRTNGFCNIIRK